ncbi:putative histone-like DNA-binding protein [Parabacteroides sp. PF5-5]|uniref:HU family DNA-binding protein n=1 Tax=unclassified Parabacteroides TaxID=2649774 RepID=UPI002476E6AB|nr:MULTISPECIES: HU family DNA-binding protein [unclassified Parabacteroides]MDH6304176.1 putative histone-like DNA-binding protein [Parabacteroides sp. PH5-39]MDH6315108.1 putative histone-like DNA-binding protein [Parabacteroides sp. PF5-13]MDH6318769.1 putative histone-like DNA-binding protein [Parabacteroides sp. PH5-13]MDH6322498.1 putative histone-like DNA-binding protein [Parabacteroides sp. PH5-8]MDH6326366.1 putative histone-like DNA-binding protein [Parabacteroides sp. PH5-41]
MSVKYALYESPTPKGNGKKQALHARVVPTTTIRMNRIIKEVSAFSSFSSSDIKGMLQALVDQLVSHLEDGNELELEGLGHFSISLSCPKVTNPRQIKTQHIRFKTVKFRCSKEVKQRLYALEFEKVARDPNGSPYSPKERKENILAHLEKYQTIQTSHCMHLNGCTRYLAKKDLKEMQQEGLIINLGQNKHSIYAML